jgi:glycosyltransferase involved in cell wall biosynthesis
VLTPTVGAPVPPRCREAGLTGPIPLLFLMTNLDRGGAEKVLTRLAAGLPREKYGVQVAALQERSGAIAADLGRASIPVHDLGMRAKWDLGVLVRLARLLRRERIQILFAFMFHPTILGRLVGWVCRVPVCISSERIMAWEGIGRRKLNRWTVPLATHVVAVSERVAAYARQEFRVPADRLTTIPNGVDLVHFRPTARPARSQEVVIGCTARLHRKNDHDSLLKAFAQIAPEWPDARLLLVGRGPEEERLRVLADRLELSARVRFAGEQADVAPFLEEMDLYVQSSIAEGMPNSILEAMATGLPVVATAVGGTPEVVVDGETGVLAPPRDPVALAKALAAFLANPAMAEAFGRAGRARVETHFGEILMQQRVEELLDRLIQQELHLVFEPSRGWVPC